MKLFVADTETTGLDGCLLGDKIVDVGIVCADTEKKTVIPVYYAAMYCFAELENRITEILGE